MSDRSSRWPKVRKMAWDRDRRNRAPCHICGEPIDYLAPPSSTPDAYEADHIVPVHMRPDLELDLKNIAPSHRRCNRQRGDGTNGTNVIGLRSRIW
jgi:5-methylcytosine-specific restriction endonuclease McrA